MCINSPLTNSSGVDTLKPTGILRAAALERMTTVVTSNRSDTMSGYHLDRSEVQSPSRYTTLTFPLSNPWEAYLCAS